MPRTPGRETQRTALGRRPACRIVQHGSPSAFAAKVALRLTVLPETEGRPTRVLDAFAGDHDLWDCATEVRSGLEVLHIERKPTRRSDLSGDNMRYLASFDLDRFDLIDLDTWGQPADQLALIARRDYRGPVTWTCIIVSMGAACGPVLAADGMDPAWLNVSRKLFGTGLRRRWLQFLAVSGYTEAVVIEPRANHLYGAVGHAAFDEARYLEHYDRVLTTGTYARVARGT